MLVFLIKLLYIFLLSFYKIVHISLNFKILIKQNKAFLVFFI